MMAYLIRRTMRISLDQREAVFEPHPEPRCQKGLDVCARLELHDLGRVWAFVTFRTGPEAKRRSGALAGSDDLCLLS